MGIDQVPLSEQAFSLGPAQYGDPVTQTSEPIHVNCWVHNRKGHHLVEGVAIAWTSRAVRVRYVGEHGREGHAWLWANAVTRT